MIAIVEHTTQYNDQVALLLRILPALQHTPEFALKGGTALNLFVENMPRLSVDIDLTYLPLAPREASLTDIDSQLQILGARLIRILPNIDLQYTTSQSPKLLVRHKKASVKIEPNPIIRGSLLPTVQKTLCTAAQTRYQTFLETQCLDNAELYAGKICAALDRQHPRDLFDLRPLVPFKSINDKVRQAFVAYVAAHSRPIAEVLSPKPKNIEQAFTQQFTGMTEEPVNLYELIFIREQLSQWVSTALTTDERSFLLSIKRAEPDWSLLPFNNLDKWPAIQWKLHNIRRMTRTKHRDAVNRLEQLLTTS